MAISHTTLEASGSTTDGTSFTTGSIAPGGWPVICLLAMTQTTTGPRVPTLSSNSGSGTWTALGTGFSIDSATGKGAFAFVGTNLTSSGTITITKNASDTTILSIVWTFLQVIGALHVPSMYQGAAIGDSDWDIIDTQTASFGSTVKATSRIYAAGSLNATTPTWANGSGLTTIEDHNISTASIGQRTLYTAGAAQSSASMTQSGGDNAQGGVIAIEVPAVVSSLSLGGAGY